MYSLLQISSFSSPFVAAFQTSTSDASSSFLLTLCHPVTLARFRTGQARDPNSALMYLSGICLLLLLSVFVSVILWYRRPARHQCYRFFCFLLILAGSVRDKLGMPLPALCIVQLPFSVCICLSFCLCLLLVISIP